ncbi:MAG: hypothetical protein J7L74_04185 [Candidatus Hydrothermae bacterium]|nr:hypothetical protein [Candidatus Hydrothermae bacterium]
MVGKTLKSVTRAFNLYRVPECRARARILPDGKLSVNFSGTGTHLYRCSDKHFEGYRYHFLDLAGADFKIVDMKNTYLQTSTAS